ncbi:MAG: rhomboid family intramembrane serine protease [Candidatus Hodarchaeota archaeon]
MNKTNWIIILCILTFLLSWYLGNDVTAEWLGFSVINLFSGRVWTLITALFLHANVLHLISNMLFLFVFGNVLEQDLGAEKTLSVFFTGGILSFLLSTFFYSPSTLIIGASAAIFSLTSVAMLVKPLKISLLFLMPLGLVAIIYFVYNLSAIYLGVEDNVAYISHILGFIIGIPFGLGWSTKWLRNLLIAITLFGVYILAIFFLFPIISHFFF